MKSFFFADLGANFDIRMPNNKGNYTGIMFSQGQEWNEQRRFSLRYLKDFGFGKQPMEELIKVKFHQ